MKLNMLLVIESVLETMRARKDPNLPGWARVADAWTLLVVDFEFASDVMTISSAIESLEDAFRDEWLDQGGKVTGSRMYLRALGLVAMREGIEGALDGYPHFKRDEVERALDAVKPFFAEGPIPGESVSEQVPEAKL